MGVENQLINQNEVIRPFSFEGILKDGSNALVINNSVALSLSTKESYSSEKRRVLSLFVTRKRGIPVGDADFFSRPPSSYENSDKFGTIHWSIYPGVDNIVYVGRNGLQIVCYEVTESSLKIKIASPSPLEHKEVQWREPRKLESAFQEGIIDTLS